jgi:GNAT superfamily N-acetyltransferase
MDVPTALRLELTDAPDLATRQEFTREMLAYNDEFLGRSRTRPLAVLVRIPDSERVAGGLWGRTSHLWLFVELLFLPESLRGRGLGGQVVRLAEAEAATRGCIGAWLDTFSPDARDFYVRQGYLPFGQIEDYLHAKAIPQKIAFGWNRGRVICESLVLQARGRSARGTKARSRWVAMGGFYRGPVKPRNPPYELAPGYRCPAYPVIITALSNCRPMLSVFNAGGRDSGAFS